MTANTHDKVNGDQAATVVERSFKTTAPDVLARPEFVSSLERHEGVLSVTPNTRRASIRVRYDVCRLNFAEVQELLREEGALGPDGAWQRLRTGWFANLDTNRRDNSQHQAACCSRPPPGAGRR